MSEFLRYSKIAGEKYNLFECVRIIYIPQVVFYLEHDVPLLDVYSSKDKKTGKPILVFLFKKEDTKDIYKLWCEENEDRS